MADIKGTETEKNLQKAFEINAKRRMEYDIYALNALRCGFEDVSGILSRFANHEKEHAKLWFKWQGNGCTASLTDNLKFALSQEKEDIEGIYEKFAQKAKEEGFDHIAGLMENIENIEKIHYDRLQKLIYKLEDNAEPNEDGSYNWVCSVCGAIFTQEEEPEYCPLCLKEDVFFYKRQI